MPEPGQSPNIAPHPACEPSGTVEQHTALVVEAQADARQAFGRLSTRAETSRSAESKRVARFIAAVLDGEMYPYNLFDLRSVDAEISDEMLRCLDALRRPGLDLHKLVPDGLDRCLAVLDAYGL